VLKKGERQDPLGGDAWESGLGDVTVLWKGHKWGIGFRRGFLNEADNLRYRLVQELGQALTHKFHGV
jgi:hypothetical protein